jgi:hypothetical protein
MGHDAIKSRPAMPEVMAGCSQCREQNAQQTPETAFATVSVVPIS